MSISAAQYFAAICPLSDFRIAEVAADAANENITVSP